MRKPRVTIVLLAAIVAAIGFNGRALIAEKQNLAAILPAESVSLIPKSASIRPVKVTSHSAAFARMEAGNRVSIPSRNTLIELSVDSAALVTEMCDLQLLANGTGLSLNSDQWPALATVMLRTQAVRQTYEAQIATSKEIARGQYRVEIPVYAGVGDVLREKFNAELRTELGDAAATLVLAKLGDRLEARFAGFGVSAQTLDITANPSGTLSDVQVTRTITYWNSVEGSDRVTTRREMHFPAVEDPTGDSWSALLAMVKA